MANLTAFEKYKLIIELFQTYANILESQSWLEVLSFEIPSVHLVRKDHEDLASIITSKVPAIVEFTRETNDTIKICVRKSKGE